MSVHATLPLEKGIPIPPARRTQVTVGYAFADMHVGDSFFRALGEGVAVNLQRSIIAASNQWRAKCHATSVRFTTRQVTENGIIGVRCWRTE